MENEIIRLKGTGDGVKIYLSENVDFSEIILNLRRRLEEFRRFFGNGHCNIYIIGKNLDKSDKLRLEAVISSMLSESNIYYGEKRRITCEKAVDELLEEKKIQKREELSEIKEIKDVVTSNFKSNRARFYEGVVKNGRIVESDGHLILMGDVEPGGKVEAIGNIVVMGKLLGCAEAGCMGNKNAYIVALDFEPEKIIIAGIEKREFSELKKDMQKAVLTDNQIYTYEYLVK